MMKKLKLFLALLAISFSILNTLPLATPSALAAPYKGSSNDPAEAEYIQWKAYKTVSQCITNDNTSVTSSEEQEILDNLFDSTVFNTLTIEPGMVFSHYGTSDSDNEISCTDRSDMGKILAILGFNGPRDFQDKIRQNSKNPKATKLSGTDIENSLDKYMKSNKLGGRASSGFKDLTGAAKYWYWTEVYRTKKTQAESFADGNFAACGGIMSNEASKSGWLERETGPFYYVGQTASGKFEVQEYKYAYYQQTDDSKLEELDEHINPTNPTCREVLKEITQARAKPYADDLNALVASGVVPKPPAITGGGDGSGAEGVECETRGSNLGWIICPIYNMFAEASQFFYNSILQPFLYAPPVDVSATNNNRTFQAWSNFRFYGNMFLVLAMIIVVFGQSIGGGLIDAYTAKKIVPRIFVAAILINTSIYLVAILVDATNILGNGISSLIMSPFGDATFRASNATAISGVIGLLLGGTIGAGSITGFVGAAVGGSLGNVVMLMLMLVVVPLLLALLGIFVTLVIRRGLILGLVLVSPVAFALYCLPNTEKYFKKWWELLVKSLLVYPIVMAIFAISNVMSLMIIENNGSTDSGSVIAGGIAGLVALFVQLIPLFAVPFAFKFAGGAMASLYAAIEGGGKRAGGMLKSRQDHAKKDYNAVSLQARQRAYDRLGARGDQRAGLRRWGNRFAQNRVGGRNLHLALAEMTAEQFKEADAQKSAGIDDEQRALTVNKTQALRDDDVAAIQASIDANGNSTVDGRHMRYRNNLRQFRTLGGRWVSEAAVDNAHQRWGGNMAQMQWSLGYEMSKAATQEEMEYLYGNYGRLNGEGSGMNLSEGQFGGMWTGASFAQQNADRQYKHYGWSADPAQGGQYGLRMSGVNMFREIDERQGNWQMMSQSADTWTTMTQEISRARRIVQDPTGALGITTEAERGQMTEADAREVIQRGARIAKSLGGGYRGQDGQWIDTGVGQGASGRTKEEIESFASLFDTSRDGTDEYMREYGVERRGASPRGPAPRSGQAVRINANNEAVADGPYADVAPGTSRAAADTRADGTRAGGRPTGDGRGSPRQP